MTSSKRAARQRRASQCGHIPAALDAVLGSQPVPETSSGQWAARSSGGRGTRWRTGERPIAGSDASSGNHLRSGGSSGTVEGREVDVERQHGRAAAGGGALYGLGILGALFYYWQQADSFWEYVWAIFPKVIFWPACMVYEGWVQSTRGVTPRSPGVNRHRQLPRSLGAPSEYR
jgi:hypothetical protein